MTGNLHCRSWAAVLTPAVSCRAVARPKGSVVVMVGTFFGRLVREEEGQNLVEYAMLVALIALVAAVGVRALGNNLGSWFDSLTGKIPF